MANIVYEEYTQGWHRLGGRTWHGRETKVWRGVMSELLQHIPTFKEVPCAIANEGENPNLNMIVRDRLRPHPGTLLPGTDQVQVPIATVSKKYQLVQHRQVLDTLASTLRKKKFDLDLLEAELCLTEFGERMWFSFTLPSYSFRLPFLDDLDKYPMNLTVNALNSVDKSTALEINFYWYRLVCSNGLVYGGNIKFKEIHRTDSIDPYAIEKFIDCQLEQYESQRQLLREWYEAKIAILDLSESKPNSGQIEKWLEKSVSKTWTIQSAARAYHIAKTGRDGKFSNIQQIKNAKFTDLILEAGTETEVPGSFVPVRNAYDMSQVLSWLAGEQGTIQQQLKWMSDIPKLMSALLKAETITMTMTPTNLPRIYDDDGSHE